MDTYSSKELQEFFKYMNEKTTKKLKKKFMYSDWKPYPECQPTPVMEGYSPPTRKEVQYPVMFGGKTIGHSWFRLNPITDTWEFDDLNVTHFMEEEK